MSAGILGEKGIGAYTVGNNFKNSSVDCAAGSVGLMAATIWRDGSF